MDSTRQPLAVMAARSMGARYLIYGIGIVGSVILARSLEASGRGAYAFITTVAMSVVAVSHLSVEYAFLSMWSPGDRRRLSGAGLMLAVVIGSVAAGVTGAMLTVFEVSMPAGVETWMLLVGIGLVPVLLAAIYVDAALVNEGLIGSVNLSELGMTTVRVAALGTAAVAGLLSVGAAVAIWAVTMPVLLVLKLPRLLRSVGVDWPSPRLVGRVVALGLRYHLGALSLALILRVDILLLSTRVSVADLGRYALAVTLAELALRAGEASSQVAVHRQIQSDVQESARFTVKVARMNGLLAAVLLAAIVITGPVLVELVFGSSFAGTTPAVAALAPGIVALGFERPFGAFIVRLKRPWLLSVGMFSGLLLNIGLNLTLIPRWGIVGAGVASSVVYVVLATWLGIWFLREGGLASAELIPRLGDVRGAVRSIRTRGVTR